MRRTFGGLTLRVVAPTEGAQKAPHSQDAKTNTKTYLK